MLSKSEQERLADQLEKYKQERTIIESELRTLEEQIKGRQISAEELAQLKTDLDAIALLVESLNREIGAASGELKSLQERHARWKELEYMRKKIEDRKGLAEELADLLRGRKLVQFLAEEHLRDMAAEASLRLGRLTGQRYALELANGCEFVIRDDYNGGPRRPVNSLSGGETFLTSLALALALSSKIQLHGRYPLGLFFLDEGFGTLDDEKLELVMSALEKIHDKERMVGVITHVKELKERLPCYLEVLPAREDGKGSEIRPHYS